LTVEQLLQTGHPKRAERVKKHLPKKARKSVCKTDKDEENGTVEQETPAVQSGLSSPSPEHRLLLEESPHAKAILDAIEESMKQKHWNPKKPSGLSPTERTVLCVIIRAQEEKRPSLSQPAIVHVTGYREDRVKKALRVLRQYRLDHTGWQLRVEEEICTLEKPNRQVEQSDSPTADPQPRLKTPEDDRTAGRGGRDPSVHTGTDALLARGE